MNDDLDQLTHHDMSEDCPICRARDLVSVALIPAAAAWELNSQLPRFSIALHGAAGLLGVMLEEDFERDDIEAALGELLDDIELQISEDRTMGGPPQGSA